MCVTDFFVFQDTVSVHRPSFYADRFLKFMNSTVFKKIHRKSLHFMPVFFLFSFVYLKRFPVCLSFERSIFKNEEELSICTKVGLSGGSIPTQRGEEGGEEGPKYGPPGWKM